MLGRGRLMGAPVIQHLRNMQNIAAGEASLHKQCPVFFRQARKVRSRRGPLESLRLLRRPENQVIILGAVIGLPFIALLSVRIRLCNRIEKRAAGYKKMTDVVHRTQQIRIKVGLKMRLEVVKVFKIDLVFIGIENLHRRMRTDHPGAFKQGLGLQLIVMICQHHKLALRHPNGCIGILGNAEVLRQKLIPEARILCGIFRENLLRRSVLPVLHRLRIRGRVHETDLEIPVGLVPNRIQHAAEKLLRGRIDRNHNGKKRLQRKLRGGLPLL